MKSIIAAAVGAVVGFGLGVVAALSGGTWMLSYLGVGPFAEESYAAKRIREGEEKLGISCAEVDAATYQFINVEMGKLLEATRQGQPWLVESRDGFTQRVSAVRDRARKCRMLQLEAGARNIPFSGNFDGYDTFLMMLASYVSASDKTAPNDPIVTKSLLEDLSRQYRELTTAPNPGRGNPSRAGDARR